MPSSAALHALPLSLHDALPISDPPLTRRYLSNRTGRAAAARDVDRQIGRRSAPDRRAVGRRGAEKCRLCGAGDPSRRAAHRDGSRSEEHTSELQSRGHLVCRLLPPSTPSLFPYTTLFRSLTRLLPDDTYLTELGEQQRRVTLTGRSAAAARLIAALSAGEGLRNVVFAAPVTRLDALRTETGQDRKSTRLNSSHVAISYAVFCRPPRPPSFPTRRSSDL